MNKFDEIRIPRRVVEWPQPHCPECEKVPYEDIAYFDEIGVPSGCGSCIDKADTAFACDMGITECPTCGAGFLEHDYAVYFGHNTDHVFGCEMCWTTGEASTDDTFMRREY